MACSSPGPQTPTTRPPALGVYDIVCEVDRNTVLRGASLEIDAGEIAGLFGSNGCGKSLFLAVCAGLVTPLSGEVRCDGRVVNADEGNRPARIGVVPQNPVFDPRLACWQWVEYAASTLGPKGGGVCDSAGILARAGFATGADRLTRDLSRSEQAHLALAAALAVEPEVLLVDGLFESLDDEASATITDCLREEAARGTAIVVVCARKAPVESFASRLLLMQNGRIGEAAP